MKVLFVKMLQHFCLVLCSFMNNDGLMDGVMRIVYSILTYTFIAIYSSLESRTITGVVA